MSRVHQIELQCEIDSQRASIQGEMSDRQGRRLPFSGWTEFAGALMQLAKDEETDPTENEEQ
jgi:hypothetical protein